MTKDLAAESVVLFRWTAPGRTFDGMHVLANAIRRHPVAAFFALAYVFAWSWWIPLAVAGAVVRPGVGWPTHMIGLCGPALAAVAVTAIVDGRAGLRDLAGRMTRWRIGRAGVVMLAVPVGLLGLGVLAVRVTGGAWPRAHDLVSVSGLTASLVPMLAGLVVLNGFGEETGWRGFAYHRLRERYGPTRAALLVAVGWAGWHAPLFFLVATFQGFSAGTLAGFVAGIAAGALVLSSVYDRTGSSIFAAACWHAAYNLSSASTATQGVIAAISTTAVMVWAAWLLLAAYRRRAPKALRPSMK